MPRLAKIVVYPIKSFDGVEVVASGFVSSGALTYDRRFALQLPDGKLVNGKHFPAMHRLRAEFDLTARTVAIATDDPARTGFDRTTFELMAGNPKLQRWCSEYFGTSVRLVENEHSGFPDDGDSPGPTVISTPTLAVAAAWFPGLDIAEMRRRFRANLEIDSADPDAGDPDAAADDCPPFWEDRLFTEDAAPDSREVVEFRIGDVVLQGVNPCARCPVPTRDSHTGEALHGFAKTFAERRRETLPPWAPRTPFDHFYRLSVNTRVGFAQHAKTLRVGDRVELA